MEKINKEIVYVKMALYIKYIRILHQYIVNNKQEKQGR